MSVTITESDLKQAYAEIAALREERRQEEYWPDELYKFVETALGDPKNRSLNRVTWKDIVRILHEHGWMDGALNTIKESFRKERKRRAELNKGE